MPAPPLRIIDPLPGEKPSDETYDPYDGPAYVPESNKSSKSEPEPDLNPQPEPDEDEPDWDDAVISTKSSSNDDDDDDDDDDYNHDNDEDEYERPTTPYRIKPIPEYGNSESDDSASKTFTNPKIDPLPNIEDVEKKDEAVKSTTPYSITVNIREIMVDPRDNVRGEYDPTGMEQLSKSYETRGQLQSVLVTPLPKSHLAKANIHEKYLLVAGFRRYFAAKKANVNELIVIVRYFKSREDALAANLEENINREEVTLYDFMKRVKQFADAGWSAENISERCGASESQCKSIIDLVENVSPQILDKLRLDESPKMVLRVQTMAKHVGKGLSKKERFEKQIEFYKISKDKRSCR
jgi:ParB/RepB/Spo0J family partition protein